MELLGRRLLIATLAALGLAAAGLDAAGAQSGDTTTTTATTSSTTTTTTTSSSGSSTAAVSIAGHGYGHGRGLGQYGAFGYATEERWTWQQITDHFYGGTTQGTIPADTHVDALLKGYSGKETLVLVEQGGLITNVDPSLPPLPGRRALRVVANPDGSFVVFQGTDCSTWDAGTTVTPAPTNGRSILIAKPGTPPTTAAEMVSVCEGSTRRFYRGELWFGHFATVGSVAGSTTAKQHVMNHVWIEDYLRSVVPSESPSSWGNATGGMNALAAQAVAARSYASAGDSRYGWATTCDDIFCQVYSGYGTGTSASSVTRRETTNTDRAVVDTQYVVRRAGSAIARTEFSSSTGGYTAGGAFPAVPDAGDDVAANPNHNWSVSVPVSRIESAFDAHHGRDFGALQRITVIDRNGLGADGGRVRNIQVVFANGSSTVSGDRFRSLVGLKSDWFTPGSLTSGGFTDIAGDPHEANINKIVSAGIATGYPDNTYRPNLSVTRGQMATFIRNGYQLPPADSPTFSDTAGTTHEANIRAVANASIAQGYPDGTYRPDQPITRGQMAVFVARAEGLTLGESTATFCDTAGHPYEEHIQAIVAAGIAQGSDGCFFPDNPVTRGQMATFLAKALGL